MHVTVVELHIKPEQLDQFLRAVEVNHKASIREPGNIRFDVLQSVDDPTRFTLYEAYINAEHAAAHRETAHYREWANKAPSWFASPRRATVFHGLFSPEADRPPDAQHIDGA